MKIVATVALLAVMASMMAGCAGVMMAPVVPPAGLAYCNREAPMSIGAVEVAPNSLKGTSTTYSVLGLVSWGDGSVNTAAKNGGLTKVDRMDYHLYNILGIYSEYTTVVYGK